MIEFKKLLLIIGGILILVVSVNYRFFNFDPNSSYQVIESCSISDIKKHLTPDTLVIFDYDNVIVECKNDVGTDAWFCAMVEALEKVGITRRAAQLKVVPIYDNIQKTSVVQLVEPDVKSIIGDLKKDGIHVLGLTLRSLCLIDTTFKQLSSVGIDISKNAIPEDGINSKLVTGSRYERGILFCDGCDKGLAFKTFLDGKPNLKYNKIVFIDDKLRHLESVGRVVKELGMKFVGIRYGYTDLRSKRIKLDQTSMSIIKKLIADVSNAAFA